MKRKSTILIILIIFILYSQFCMDTRVVKSIRFSGENDCSEYITALANKLIIFDKESYAMELIQRRIDNSFKEVLFTKSYPDEIEFYVYTNAFTSLIKYQFFKVECYYIDCEKYVFNIK